MGKTAAFFMSSVSGNTRKVAEGVRATLVELGWNVCDVAEANDSAIAAADVVIVCFWCRKSSLDPASIAFVESCEAKKILLFGTMGSFPYGKYGATVRDTVSAKVAERNECLGVFLCQGKVNPKRIEQRRALPPGNRHRLDEWGVARLQEGQKHPNETDILYAQAFARDYMRDVS